MLVHFSAEVVEWRGPAPFLFAPVPMDVADVIRDVAKAASYGWGCLPATVTIGATTYTTSLFPKDGTYFVPVKVAVQRAEKVHLGDHVEVSLQIGR